jgi:hypothetical protein
LVLLLAGGVVAFFMVRKKDRHEVAPTTRTTEKAPFGAIKAADLDALEITAAPEAPGGTPVKVQLEKPKGASSWNVVTPFADKANVDSMRDALDGLDKVSWVEPVADSKEAVDKLGCDDAKGAHVVAKSAGKVLADVYVCREGGRARSAARSQIWEVKGLDRWRYAKADVRAWRDLTILEVPTAEVAEVAIEKDGQKVRIQKEPPPKVDGGPVGDKWALVEGPAGMDALDEPTVQTLVSHLARMSGDNVVTVSDAEAGLDKPSGSLEVKTQGGGTVKLAFGKALASGNVYARREGDARIFEVLKATANETLPAPRQLENRAIAGLVSADVSGLTVEAQGEKVVLVKDGTWKATSPASFKADTGKVQGLAGQLATMRAAEIADATPKEAGLDKPAATVTLTTKAGKSVTLKLGSAKASSRYISRQGTPWIYLLDINQVSALLKKPSDALK